MPDRILRDELLESERWLSLARNTYRLAFVCLIPKGDALGNMEATDGHLWRIWRDPCKLENRSIVPEILGALVEADLIRIYEADGKRFIHIPRYRQELRWISRLCPLSPWTTEEEKQKVKKNSHRDHDVPTPSPHRAHATEVKRSEVEVKRREEKRSAAAPSQQNDTQAAQPINTILEKIKFNTQRKPHMTQAEQVAYAKAHANEPIPKPPQTE